ncbi:MAG: carboxypeptidase regulatory-like domain-containing protein [Acidobacteriota bacterium]|nr:carboxypeptidase regulatory-like domain-containing protein [Acidobacteriota bacterium]
MRVKLRAFWLLLLIPVVFLGFSTSGGALPQSETLKGEVVNDANAPVPNAICSLSGHNLGQQGLSATTDERGNFQFPGLMPGSYSLTCAALDLEPTSKPNIIVEAGKALSVLRIVLPKEVFRQEVTVRGHAGLTNLKQAAPPASFSSHELMTLPLAQLKFKAALPLVPGVVRTPDGKLSIKGAREEQGLLLVDGADLVDPVTGAFSVEVPIDAIEELQVYKSPYLAQYGRFSGGLTVIHTKPPLPNWHWEINDIIPDIFIEQGHIQGIAGDAPRFYLTGPLIKDKLNFSESFIYDLNRVFTEGLPWPKNIQRREGVSSFTSFQYVISPQNLLNGNFKLFPARREFDNISSLLPEPASSNYGQRGYSYGGVDRYMRKSGGILTSLVQATEFDTYGHGQGPLPMEITPNGFGGNYFNAYTRFADQLEWMETYDYPKKQWFGAHDIEIGGDYFHRSYEGTSNSQPELIKNLNGGLLESIDFSGLAHLSAEDTEFEGYAQDHWTVGSGLGIDAGLRFSTENIGNAAAFSPRLGFVYSPSRTGRTIVRGGAGVFYNRVAMLASDYPENPIRTITLYGPDGKPLGPPVIYTNEYSLVNRHGEAYFPVHNQLGSTPYDNTWSFEIDQELRPNWLVRASYLSSRAYDEYIVTPTILSHDRHAFVLTNTGSARYREFEATTRWRAGERADFNLSYVHSLTRGDLNTLSALFVPFQKPIIRPNFFGDLPADIPNRIITWSEVSVPWGLTVSPLFDIHTGFPFSSVDALQNYVGTPEGFRFPRFYSLDVKISKDFHIPFLHFGLLKNHKFRGAFEVYDITNHKNPVDVYNNIASPYYHMFTGFQHMTFNTFFDLIY